MAAQDKAFEGSLTRKVTIILLTYLTLYGYMNGIGVDQPALNAIIPAIGFTLSTLSLPYVKQLWSYIKKKSESSLVVVPAIRSQEDEEVGERVYFPNATDMEAGAATSRETTQNAEVKTFFAKQGVREDDDG